jgi:hypothetical protein
MSFQDVYNDPDFRRRSNAASDSILKIVGSAITAAAIGIFNFIKAMVMMVFGK